MKKKILVLACCLLLTGCGKEAKNTTTTSQEATTEVAENRLETDPDYQNSLANAKAMSMSGMQVVAKLEKGDNLLFCPFSMDSVLGMVIAGADDTSKQELLSFLLKDKPEEELHKELRSYREHMIHSPNLDWMVSNSLWSENVGKLENKTTELISMYYDVELHNYTPGDVGPINTYVKDRTHNRMQNMIDSSAEDKLYLLNTVAFDGRWKVPFSEAGVSTFYNADGSVTETEMMVTDGYRKITWAGGTGFIKPYEGGEFTFVAILPPDGMQMKDYLNQCLSEAFTDAYKSDMAMDMQIVFPKMHREDITSLSPVLQDMGVTSMFVNAVSLPGLNDLSVKDIINQACLDVDTGGTRPATTEKTEAITETAMRFDRPFLYMVVDDITGLPLLVGVQMSF